MKKIILTAVVFMGLTATAQVKIGNNPSTLSNATSNFEVEGTTTTEQFVILKDGKVGIGTTTPSAPLHIASTSAYLFLQDTDAVSGTGGATCALKFRHSTGSGLGIIGYEGSVSQTLLVGNNLDQPVVISNATGKIVINTGGNVSIQNTPTITTATKVLVKEPVTDVISEQDINLGNMPVVNTTSTPALAGDVFVSPNGGGVILVSPDGLSKWKISVSNTGTLITTKTP